MKTIFFEAISCFQHSLFLPKKGKKELKQMLQSGLDLFAGFKYNQKPIYSQNLL